MKKAFKKKLVDLVENPASIGPAIAELERVYRALASLFQGLAARPYPRIIIQSRGRRRYVLGWFARERWRGVVLDAPAIHEVTIAAEALHLPALEIIAILVHEMVHLVCHYAGIQDVGKDDRYHNRRYKVAAEEAGLLVEKDMRLGWAVTSLGPELKEFISGLNVNADAFAIFRLGEPEYKKQPTKGDKWTCGCKLARITIPVNWHCDDCDNVVANETKGQSPYPRRDGVLSSAEADSLCDVVLTAAESIKAGKSGEALRLLVVGLYERGKFSEQDAKRFKEIRRVEKEEALLSEEISEEVSLN
jgi:hypothetical protein